MVHHSTYSRDIEKHLWHSHISPEPSYFVQLFFFLVLFCLRNLSLQWEIYTQQKKIARNHGDQQLTQGNSYSESMVHISKPLTLRYDWFISEYVIAYYIPQTYNLSLSSP